MSEIPLRKNHILVCWYFRYRFTGTKITGRPRRSWKLTGGGRGGLLDLLLCTFGDAGHAADHAGGQRPAKQTSWEVIQFGQTLC